MQKLGFGSEVERLFRQWVLSRDQPEWYAEHVGAQGSMSTTQFIARLREVLTPDEMREVTKLVVGNISKRFDDNMYSPEQRERERQIKLINDGDEVFAPTIDHGVNFATSFETFVDRPKQPDVAKAKRLIQRWVNTEAAPIVSLLGEPGIGKTMLAEAAACVLIARDEDVVYRTESDLISELRRGFGNNSADTTMDAIKSARWLILDDIGREALSETFESKMDEIIDARWRNAGYHRTLITSNIPRTSATGGKVLPPRIASRLSDVTKATGLQMDATDYRQDKGRLK